MQSLYAYRYDNILQDKTSNHFLAVDESDV